MTDLIHSLQTAVVLDRLTWFAVGAMAGLYLGTLLTLIGVAVALSIGKR